MTSGSSDDASPDAPPAPAAPATDAPGGPASGGPDAAPQAVAAGDAVWIQMESPTNPMMITGVLWFDTPPDWAAVTEVIRRRLVGRYPRFSQRVVHHPLTGLRWEPDPHFHLALHLHRIALPAPGDEAALQRYVSHRMSRRLEPDRPLWDVTFVEGYGDGAALVARLHHGLADGISLARVLLSLADAPDAAASRDARPVEAASEAEAPSSTGDPVAAGPVRPWTETMASVARTAGRLVASSAHATSWLDPATLGRLVRQGGDGAATAARLLAMPADPPTPFTEGPLGPRKRAAWAAPLALDRVKSVARALGGTVNDLLLAAVTGALHDTLVALDHPPPERLCTFVPVNLRPLDAPVPRTLGNRFGLVFLPLPVGEPDPRERMRRVKAEMDRIKASPEAVVTFAMLRAMGASPFTVERLLVDVFDHKASAIMTNVPGPRQRLTLAGTELAGLMFWVPQSGRIGLGVSILSYGGEVRVGVAADARRLDDPGALARRFTDAFAELERLADA